MGRRKRRVQRVLRKKNLSKEQNWFKKLIGWLVASGVAAAALSMGYQFFVADVTLNFLRPLGRGYEFQLKNETPSDRVVNRFRVVPPHPQNIIFKTTQDVYAEQDEHGQVILPGGNASYVPAAEFKELDGVTLPAGVTKNFRVPPLSSRSWMEPEATIVNVVYETRPLNWALAVFESMLNVIGLRKSEESIRYLVINNYWTITQSTSPDEAIRVACRDDDSLAKMGICSGLP